MIQAVYTHDGKVFRAPMFQRDVPNKKAVTDKRVTSVMEKLKATEEHNITIKASVIPDKNYVKCLAFYGPVSNSTLDAM